MFRQRLSAAVLASLTSIVTACVTATPVDTPASDLPMIDPVAVPDVLPETTPVPRPASFEELPNWHERDFSQAAEAFTRSCARIMDRAHDAPISDRIAYAGTVSDWRSACEAMTLAQDAEGARLVFEALFVPMEVMPAKGTPRFTGYFEPEITARRAPVYPYTQPVPGLPDDFEQGRPYLPRAQIAHRTENALGFAHPADVFFLQIQGSGRLVFEDGATLRAAYAGHNGQPFRSTANFLINSGRITRGEASMQGIRAWMDRVSREEAQAAMNANPRFVFFRPLPIGDASLGPEGAQGVPLTPLGSMAVDTSIHPLGVPFFVQTTSPGLGGDWSGLLVAQDTGGAIKGRVRGDIYFGTGEDAGVRAGTQNAPGRMWALLPRAVAERIATEIVPPES